MKAGAIVKWNKTNQYYYSQLESLANHYKFSLDKPFKDLSKIQNIILYGSGDEIIEMTVDSIRGGRQIRNKTFEGVIQKISREDIKSQTQIWSKKIFMS